MFVGRKKELALLQEHYAKAGSNVLVLYGHKGVGKTTLLMRYAQGKPCFYYLARPCAEEEQVLFWEAELADTTADTKGAVAYEGFDAILRRILSAPAEHDKKRILVIDEFQNIIKYSGDFMQVLMRVLKETATPVMIVLSSSSISFVENDFVPRIGALALGISGFFKLQELGFMDCVNYFGDYSTRDCMEVYSILGGIPAYWAQFDRALSVAENVKHAVLSAGSVLREEGTRLVSEELRELNVYTVLLSCMARGMNKLNDLHAHTGFSRAKISVYLKNLMERELVEKVFSFDNASSTNAKKGIYRITLRYLEFYFRFIFPHQSMLEQLESGEFYRRYILPGIGAFHQGSFRKVCAEYLGILNENHMLPIEAVRSGEWVGKEGSIDIVMQNADWDSLLAFCDWESAQLTAADLDRYLKIIDMARLHPDYVYLFSTGKFSEDLKQRAQEDAHLTLIDIDTL